MNAIVHVITDTSVTVINTEDGTTVKYFEGDKRYLDTLNFIRDGCPEHAFGLDLKTILLDFLDGGDAAGRITIEILHGAGIVTLHDHGDLQVPLSESISSKIMKIHAQGFDCQPIMNFVANLYDNPSMTAVQELFLFIDANELPITEDGCFIAYKIVRGDYLDIYSGTVSNKIGEFPSMPRNLVDDRRDNTCSNGLHFCSKSYLSHYGSGVSKHTDRCMLVKINPAHVVSIPSDYNNAKGRAECYEVVGEIENGWRAWLPVTDYTDYAVVSAKAEELPTIGSLMKTEEFSEEFKFGYLTGFDDGKHKRTIDYSDSAPSADYVQGYNRGYKDGRQKRAKLIK